MKKQLLILFIIFSSCNIPEDKLIPSVLDLNLECKNIYYTEGRESFIILFRISYENKSDIDIFLKNNKSRLTSKINNDSGFTLINGSENIALSSRFAENYIVIKNNSKGYLNLIAINRVFKDSMIANYTKFNIIYKGVNFTLEPRKHFSNSLVYKNPSFLIPIANAKLIELDESSLNKILN